MLGPILAFAGSALSGMMNNKSAKDNRRFQEEMSSTAHQREVADLKAAGLNPMLSAKLGGASSPGGSTATFPDMGATLNNATQATRVKAEIDKIKADTKTAESQAHLNEVMAIKQDAETRLTLSNAQRSEFEYKRVEYLQSEFDSWFVEGKELTARQAKATTDRLRESNDYNTIQFLNEYAVKQGYRNFDEAVNSQEFRNNIQNFMYNQLKFPQAHAMADFYRSPYGKEIAPYLSSAGGASDLIGTVGAGLSLGRRVFGSNFLKGGK